MKCVWNQFRSHVVVYWSKFIQRSESCLEFGDYIVSTQTSGFLEKTAFKIRVQIKTWKLRHNIILFCSIFHQASLQGEQNVTAVIFCTDNRTIFFPFTCTKACASISQQRSQHAGNVTLAHHANSRNGCMDILLAGNDRLYIVLANMGCYCIDALNHGF